jgi:hypothetical protein
MNAKLEAVIDTSIPGHRKVTIGATTYTVASSLYTFSGLVTAVDAAISGASWDCAWSASTGAVTFSTAGSAATLKFADWLGPMLGFNAGPASTALGTATSHTSTIVPRGAIPLYGATWTEVDTRKESALEFSRLRRSQGHVWGRCRVWRVVLTLSADDLEALRAGPCLRGRVYVTTVDASDISNTNDDGRIQGWVLGVESQRWLDKIMAVGEITLLLAGHV